MPDATTSTDEKRPVWGDVPATLRSAITLVLPSHPAAEIDRVMDAIVPFFETAWVAGYGHAGEGKPEPPSLPDGEYARVEVMGHDQHTGWVTDGTRAGVPVLVVKDWDGRTIAEVPGGSLYRFVPLATPLKRPEPRGELAAWSAENLPADDDYEEGGPF